MDPEDSTKMTWTCIVFLDAPVPNIPQPCTVRFLVTNYLDMNCVPRRSFFEMLLYFADDELERDKLKDFCSPEGQVKMQGPVVQN